MRHLLITVAPAGNVGRSQALGPEGTMYRGYYLLSVSTCSPYIANDVLTVIFYTWLVFPAYSIVILISIRAHVHPPAAADCAAASMIQVTHARWDYDNIQYDFGIHM